MGFSALLGSRWRMAGGLLLLSGVVAIVLAPSIGKSTFEQLWGVEPLTYIGAILVIAGLTTVTASYVARRNNGADDAMRQWSEVTQEYFELFQHDLGRPFTRIVARERELRALLANAEELDKSAVMELLDEIERQSPNFRLMLSNIQVLVHLEAPDPVTEPRPVEPSEVVRRIVDRYVPVAAEGNKDITWWSEPEQFGIVYSDTSAIEHIATNLIDNAVRFATQHIEVKLTKNQTHFFVRVWDDGTGIAPAAPGPRVRPGLDARVGAQGREEKLRPRPPHRRHARSALGWRHHRRQPCRSESRPLHRRDREPRVGPRPVALPGRRHPRSCYPGTSSLPEM